MTRIAYKIRKIRELKNLSQEYVATRMGLNQSTYSRIESGMQKLDIDQLLLLSKIFEVDSVDILNFDESHIFNAPHPPEENTTHLTIHNLSQELIHSYESQIKALKEEIQYLRKKLG